MPNHVSHRVVVRGEPAEVDAFKTRAIVPDDDGDPRFDFNAFVPMPAILDGTISGSLADQGLLLLGRGDLNGRIGPSSFAEMLAYPWARSAGITSEQELIAYIRKQHPEAEAAGQRAIDCYNATGCIDWYQWSMKYWGTKWNAYQFAMVRETPGEIEFVFQTAWSVPRPVLRAASAAFPGLTFDVAAYDEGDNFAVRGIYAGGNGGADNIPVTPELYRYVYGHEKPVYDEDGNEIETESQASEVTP